MDKNESQHDLTWQIDRYLLGDESFDRDAFESRMLDDESLALAVAEEMGQLQTLAKATSMLKAHETSHVMTVGYASSASVVTIALLTVAASVLCLTFALQWFSPEENRAVAESRQEDPQLQQLALRWVAFEDQIIGHDLNDVGLVDIDLVDIDAESAFMESGDTVGMADPSSDWMMDASEFFRDADI